ncbi:MAG: DeoR/GlpR family DNA-binding transcription regulator [Pleomorphochaeta sp.]
MKNKEFIIERQNSIKSYIISNRRANVSQLAETFGVTEVTIRRDLIALEKQGHIVRTHGGAISNTEKTIWQKTSIESRLNQSIENKKAIAKATVKLLKNGQSIFLDGGSTISYLTKEMSILKELFIVTNSLSIAQSMVGLNGNRVILTGGELESQTDVILGPTCVDQINLYRADVAIIGVSGLLIDEGIFSSIPQEKATKSAMINNAKTTIVVADSSKIDQTAFTFVESLEKIDVLVTDKNLDKEKIKRLNEKNINLVLA